MSPDEWFDANASRYDSVRDMVRDAVEYALPREWLIWSNEHRAWWGPNRCGYPTLAIQAGRYTLTEARAICRNRHWDDPNMPPETMIHLSEVEHAAR